MKETIKQAFKPTPERFRYAVSTAVRKAEHAEPAHAKKRPSRPARVLIAAALILAVVPTAVFGATKLISLFAKPVDTYGVELSMETANPNYPAYVKMHVELPDGVASSDHGEGLKYDTQDGGAFSLCPMRGRDSNDREVVGNVGSYEEITLCGRSAYKVKSLYSGSYERVYVSYPDVNVILLVYYDNVTEDELNSFLSGITFAEGTAADHTELVELFDERIEDKVSYVYNYKNIELDPDTVMTFRGWSEQNNDDSLRYTAQVNGVRTVDNINGLDGARINRMYTDSSRRQIGSEALTDTDGNLLPRTITVTKYGDGFTTIDEVLSSEEMEQEIILIDLNYTNLSGEDITVYIPFGMEVMNRNDDDSFTPATDVDTEHRIFATDYCDREMLYNSDPLDQDKMFYNFTLKAHETKAVTIGYRCSTAVLDKAYLTIVDASSSGIVDPAPDDCDGSDSIQNYIIKVL